MGHDAAMTTIGFLGVGTISEAMVRAMRTRPDPGPDIVLSPRSADRSMRLAEEFPRCRRMASNQDVVDASDIVVLGMRPPQLDEAVSGLAFREDQIVASLIAGTPPSGVAPMVAPAARVCTLIPLPSIALHRGPLVICPPIPLVVDSCHGLGEIITLDDESRIRTLSSASAVLSTYYEMQNALISWIADHGIDETTASRYVRAELDGLAAVGMVTPDADRAHLPAEHQTKGGLNERVRGALLEAGWFDALVGAIDEVHRTAVLR